MRIAIFSPMLHGGGVQSVSWTLAKALAERGYGVDLVVTNVQSPGIEATPETVNVWRLTKSSTAQGLVSIFRAFPGEAVWTVRACAERRGATRQMRSVVELARYLRRRQPDVLIANLWHCGVAAVRARAIAGTSTEIVAVVHSNSLDEINRGKFPRSLTARLIGRMLARADACVAVSDGLARAFEHTVGMPAYSVQTIHNPVAGSGLLESARSPVAHPWFADGTTPVVVGVGRLVQSKGFDIMIDAFAQVRRRRPLRLAILGDGPERASLEARANDLGVAGDVAFIGWVTQPAAYMVRSAMLVSASRIEGLGNVLIEALACGCPVVATDCPSGPAEVLDHGRYGRLVAVDDAAGLAAAIEATLDVPPAREVLQSRGGEFSVDKAVAQYEKLIVGLRRGPQATLPSAKVEGRGNVV